MQLTQTVTPFPIKTWPGKTKLGKTRTRSVLMALGLGLSLTLGQVAPALAQTVPASFADLAEKFSPAVVDITTSSVIAAPADGQPQVPPGSPFEKFFQDFMDKNGQGGGSPQQQQPERSEALGSGYVISADGYIVTNNHVIEGADDIQIEMFGADHKVYKAKLVGKDLKTDVALLKIESPEPLPFVSFGDSDKMRVGDWVVAMGNPLGQGFSVSAGIVSARGRELNGTYDDFLQTDAAINKGNSGGPLFNMDGQVIGMNTAILSPSGGSIGIGFSMSSNVVSKVVDQLKQFGETRRGWLGVRIQDVTPDMVDAIAGLDSARGAMVTDVPEGPSLDAGMLSGDVLLTFNGVEVPDTRELIKMVGGMPVGQSVPVEVLRNGEMITLTVVLGRREDAEAAALPASVEAPEPVQSEMLGLTLSDVTDALKQQFQLGDTVTGLVITAVDPLSDAGEKGIVAGDIITEAGQQPVATVADFTARIEEATAAGRKSLLLLVRRGGDPRFVALSIEQ